MSSSYFSSLENCPLEMFDDFKNASKFVSQKIEKLVTSQKRVTLGLCSGSSPSEVYNDLVALYSKGNISFKNVTVFLLDEFYPIKKSTTQSKLSELTEKLFSKIDIPKDNIFSLNGENRDYEKECKNFEEKIKNAGGLDFLLVGVGGTGHIGANEPGTYFASRTHLAPLDRVTRIAAASDFKGEQFVPSSALTMGLGTIMEAKEIVLLAFGEGKAGLVKKIVEGDITKALPATVLQNHSNMTLVLDRDAGSKLKRVHSPWTKQPCDWSNDRFVRKAVIWLARQTKKSILKLTNRDYMDNGMADLITIYGSAYSLNLKIFNEIQDTITGWPGGKPNVPDEGRPERAEPASKRVVVFSPHPDDDVISMGGTLQRLVDHKHEVHVAYQTNGNVAVADDKVQDILDLLTNLNKESGIPLSIDEESISKIENSIYRKDPLAADSKEVQFLKGLIRKVETISACRYVGIPLNRNHHLDLPFYRTGEVRKKPLSQEDIDIVKEVLQKVQPHQIFAAGDLADPHGTHRVCLNAIFAALSQLKEGKEEWLKSCRVWLYRGAWAEWPISEADMAVPISPEELMKKRISIFKHGSQKDGVVFPGSDAREFWQRAEARNRGTAEKYNSLGFAEYEAIELFVRYNF